MADEPEEPEAPEPDPDPGDGGNPPDPAPSGEALILERLEAILPSLEELFADNDPGEPVTTPAADHKSDIKAQVAAALSEIQDGKETKERLEKIERIVEKPPIKQSRLSRALWGRVDA